MKTKTSGFKIYMALVFVNLIYACVTIFTKFTSLQEFISFKYFLGLCGSITVMGVYAILWQQVLRKIDLSIAYMFKGTSLIFVLLISYFAYGEEITLTNIIGAAIIIIGISLFANTE